MLVKHLLSGGAAVVTDIKPCAQPRGRTGGGSPAMEWKCWLNIWDTCQMSTKWDGEDGDLQKQHSTQISQLPKMFVPSAAAPKYSSGIRGRCMPRRMLLRGANTNWVSAIEGLFEFSITAAIAEVQCLFPNVQLRGFRQNTKATGRKGSLKSKKRLVNNTTDIMTLTSVC